MTEHSKPIILNLAILQKRNEENSGHCFSKDFYSIYHNYPPNQYKPSNEADFVYIYFLEHYSC